SGCIRSMTWKWLRSSFVSNVASGEPLSNRLFFIIGIPVALPSVKSSSFKKSPRRRFLVIRNRIVLQLVQRAFALIYRHKTGRFFYVTYIWKSDFVYNERSRQLLLFAYRGILDKQLNKERHRP